MLAASAPALAAAGGKLAVGSLFKLVPGVGSVISAGVAATITGALGESWRTDFERFFTGRLDLDDLDQVTKIAKFFVDNVKCGLGAADDLANDKAPSTP